MREFKKNKRTFFLVEQSREEIPGQQANFENTGMALAGIKDESITHRSSLEEFKKHYDETKDNRID